jgi:hypothetical protein
MTGAIDACTDPPVQRAGRNLLMALGTSDALS